MNHDLPLNSSLKIIAHISTRSNYFEHIQKEFSKDMKILELDMR
jgi:hypothetical protein